MPAEAAEQGERVPIWLHARVRFAVLFLVLLGLGQWAFYVTLYETEAFYDYLRLNTRAAGWILSLFEAGVLVDGLNLTAASGSIRVGSGCGGLRPLMIFLAGVLAFPSSLRWRCAGLVIGSALLLAINVIRIATLFYAQVFWPESFDHLHLELWPSAFILFAVVAWLAWAVGAARPPARE